MKLTVEKLSSVGGEQVTNRSKQRCLSDFDFNMDSFIDSIDFNFEELDFSVDDIDVFCEVEP